MAELLAPGVIRAQVVFENVSKKPEDRIVNTFHFTDEAGYSTTTHWHWLARFYTEPTAPNTASVSSYLSPKLSRDAFACQVRLYDLGQAPPREPEVHFFTLDPAGSSSPSVPNEVCSVLSFYGDRNLPRQRGRIYIGPLAATAIEDGTPDLRVSGAFRNAVADAARTLRTGDGTFKWCVYSTVSGSPVTHDVTAGWIDNAFDTQRRRGAAATDRLTW